MSDVLRLKIAVVTGASAGRCRSALAQQAEPRGSAAPENLWHSAVERSGFREYYDPISGEGHGAREFTWSGLIVDMQ